MSLFTLRYRKGNMGVIVTFVEASSLAKAQEVGQKFCNSMVNAKYITVEAAVAATEDILKPEVAARVVRSAVRDEVGGQLTEEEQNRVPETTDEEEAEAQREVDALEAIERKRAADAVNKEDTPTASRPVPKHGNKVK